MPKIVNNEYLKFDAFSIKNAIIQKLSDDTNFTEQVFEDSNLTAIVDVFSVVFEYMMYYVNHGASESIFSDSVIYENINRIVKVLGYNPMGNISSKATISFQNASGVTDIFTDATTKEIMKYAYIDTGLTDSSGKTIFYSLIRNVSVNKNSLASENNIFTVVNGRWKAYGRTFIATGEPFETISLDALPLDGDDKVSVAHPYIDVYVKTTDSLTSEARYDYYEAVPEGNIFSNNTSILTPTSQKFELRIEEDKTYSIKFGDGIHGKKLKSDDEVFIVYIDGNGDDSKIGINAINSNGAVQQGIAGLSQDLVFEFLQTPTGEGFMTTAELDNVLFKNVTESTQFTPLEDVDSIKDNAPDWFKSGGHLVTRADYRKFMLTNFSADIYSTKIMNDYEYKAKFFKWLYDYNSLSIQIRNYNYKYSDSCDFNNIYIWIKPKYTDLNKQYMLDSMDSRKTLTAEPIIQDALDTIIVPCLNFDESSSQPTGYNNLRYSIDDWDTDFENWIEIHKDINSFISIEKIKSVALREIRNFFNPLYNQLGEELNFTTLYTTLLSISGVKRVRTAFKPVGGSANDIQYYNGISFAKWTPLIISGQDVELIKGSYQLEDFQFPVLLETNLENRIKVVSESFNQTSIEY